jgi:GDPmannose 4,6-dehydratase
MKKKIALITGIAGQDASYLAKLLIKKNYTIIGTSRNPNSINLWRLKKFHIHKKINIIKLNLNSSKEIKKLFNKYGFDEIYNLSSQSSVKRSFEKPIEAINSAALVTAKILEEIKKNKKIKFFQASSSEMFGNNGIKVQNENSAFRPESPYGASKLLSHNLVRIYRTHHNIHACCGILFNHDSPFRNDNFILKKIIKNLIKIKKKKINSFAVGDINIIRDWGFSQDYVHAMWKILQQKKPDDYIVATGSSYSLKQIIQKTSDELGLDAKWIKFQNKESFINKKSKKTLIKINEKLIRNSENYFSFANPKKIFTKLRWKAKTNLDTLIKIMIKEIAINE